MHERRLPSMFSVRDLYFTISWICCTSENKISYPREREIGMLCFFKGERVWKGYWEDFVRASGLSQKVRWNLWIPDLSFVVRRPYSRDASEWNMHARRWKKVVCRQVRKEIDTQRYAEDVVLILPILPIHLFFFSIAIKAVVLESEYRNSK